MLPNSNSVIIIGRTRTFSERRSRDAETINYLHKKGTASVNNTNDTEKQTRPTTFSKKFRCAKKHAAITNIITPRNIRAANTTHLIGPLGRENGVRVLLI